MLKLSMSKVSLFKLLGSNFQVQTRRPESTWRKRPAWKRGHWEHLDVTRETADYARGECQSFPHLDITKVGQRLKTRRAGPRFLT